jgi:hypothetical protein
MSNVEIFLKYASEKKIKIYDLIDKITKQYDYRILSDSLINDYRTVHLQNNKKDEIKIVTTIILDKNYYKHQFIDIYYRNVSRNFSYNFITNI